MASTIKIKNSSTASAVPTSSDLVQGELAINVTDKRMFTENSGGTVVELGTNPSSLTLSGGTANGVAYLNGSKVLTTGSALSFDATTVNVATATGNTTQLSGTTGGTYIYGLGRNGANGAELDSYDAITFRTGSTSGARTGSEKMRLDQSGNLGLGVTPSAWTVKAFDIGLYASFYTAGSYATSVGNNVYYDGSLRYKTSGYQAAAYQQDAGRHFWYTAPSGTAGNTISFTQAMTLDASGNLLVGTTSNASYGGSMFVTSSTNANVAAFLQGAGSPYGPAIAFTGAAPNNTTNYFINAADTSATRFTVRSNGGIANYSANNLNLSDRREKANFAPAKSYLDVICAIPVQTYNYIDQNLEEDDGLTLGVVAQDVQAIAPELVTESNWGTEEEPKMRLSIYQTDMQYALMKCIQEQQALITQLQADVAALKA